MCMRVACAHLSPKSHPLSSCKCVDRTGYIHGNQCRTMCWIDTWIGDARVGQECVDAGGDELMYGGVLQDATSEDTVHGMT